MSLNLDQFHFNLLLVRSDPTGQNLAQISHANRSANLLLGYDENQLTGKFINDIFATGDELARWQTTCANLLNNLENNSFTGDLITVDQRLIPALFSLSPITQTIPEFSEIVVMIQPLKLDNDSLWISRVVEQSASAMMITDHAGRIEYVNPKFTELTGYTKAEVLGQNPKMLQSGNMAKEHYHAMWQVLAQTGEWHGEIQNLRKNGELYWVYESISAIKNSKGETTHYVAVEEDITRRKHAETALFISEERFRQMAEMTGEWLWEQDPDGYYIYSSNAVNQILGYSETEVKGRHYTDFLTSQGKQYQQPFADSQQPFYALINHYQHKNGNEILTESTGLPIIGEQGRLIKWRGVDRDITARVHFQEALIESEKRTRLIIESSIDAIVIMDSYGIINDWNKRAEKMFGWSNEEAVGLRLDSLIIPERLQKSYRQGLEKFLHSGDKSLLNQQPEHQVIRRNGKEFPAEINISPLKLGNAYIFSIFIHDITSRKAAEEAIRQTQVNLAIAQNEIRIAQQIQATLLPSSPIIANDFEITGVCLTADKAGGDYFDYFFRNNGQLDMVIADVSGHSVGPALFMVETRSAMRSQTGSPVTPAETLAALNHFLFEDLNKSDYFITLFYLQADLTRQVLKFSNAGHPPPLLYRAMTGTVKELDTDGLLLGIKKTVVFEEKTMNIERGDCILFYTDGLTETENSSHEFFGLQRVEAILLENADKSPQAIIDAMFAALRDFSQRTLFNDDITLMVFKYK